MQPISISSLGLTQKLASFHTSNCTSVLLEVSRQRAIVYLPVATHTIELIVLIAILGWALSKKRIVGIMYIFVALLVCQTVLNIVYELSMEANFVSTIDGCSPCYIAQVCSQEGDIETVESTISV